MQIEFLVHNAAMSKSTEHATIEGEAMVIPVDCLEVELTTTRQRHGSLTLRFIGKEVPDAREYFKVGTTVFWRLEEPFAEPAPVAA